MPPNEPQYPLEIRTGSTFCTTQWSMVLAAGEVMGPRSRQALEALCRAYWYPLYAYVRRRGHSAGDAQDLVQGFFLRLIEKNIVANADPERGRFRSYLLKSIQFYMANEWDRARAKKRGGGRTTIPLDSLVAEQRFGSEPSHAMTAERLFDRRWALTLLEQVLAQLKAQYLQKGTRNTFDRLKAFIGGDVPGVTYKQVGQELGMSESAVKVAVHRLRKKYGELLRAAIAQTLANPLEVDDEINHLFSILAP